jgi:hypothetical protein
MSRVFWVWVLGIYLKNWVFWIWVLGTYLKNRVFWVWVLGRYPYHTQYPIPNKKVGTDVCGEAIHLFTSAQNLFWKT